MPLNKAVGRLTSCNTFNTVPRPATFSKILSTVGGNTIEYNLKLFKNMTLYSVYFDINYVRIKNRK